jgi:hypothetical protein
MGEAPGLVRFVDGSQVFILPSSHLKLSVSGDAISLVLSSGGIAYRFTPGSSLEIRALSNRVSSTSDGEGQGRIWFEGSDAWWSPSGANYMIVTSIRGADDDITTVSERVSPKNIRDVEGWRDYEPDWSQQPGGTGSGSLPPTGVTDPNDPPAISSREP